MIEAEHKKVKVKSVGTPRKAGNSQVTQFTVEDDKTIYEVWGTIPLEYVKPEKEFEIDVDFSEKESQGQIYQHHTVTQIYVGGTAVLKKGNGGKRGYGGVTTYADAPERTASIEAQKAAELVVNLGCAFLQADPAISDELLKKQSGQFDRLLTKALKWCDAKLSYMPITTSAPTSTPAPASTAAVEDQKITEAEHKELLALMKRAEPPITETQVGRYCNKDKGWRIAKLTDLTKSQYDQVITAIEKGMA